MAQQKDIKKEPAVNPLKGQPESWKRVGAWGPPPCLNWFWTTDIWPLGDCELRLQRSVELGSPTHFPPDMCRYRVLQTSLKGVSWVPDPQLAEFPVFPFWGPLMGLTGGVGVMLLSPALWNNFLLKADCVAVVPTPQHMAVKRHMRACVCTCVCRGGSMPGQGSQDSCRK